MSACADVSVLCMCALAWQRVLSGITAQRSAVQCSLRASTLCHVTDPACGHTLIQRLLLVPADGVCAFTCGTVSCTTGNPNTLTPAGTCPTTTGKYAGKKYACTDLNGAGAVVISDAESSQPDTNNPDLFKACPVGQFYSVFCTLNCLPIATTENCGITASTSFLPV